MCIYNMYNMYRKIDDDIKSNKLLRIPLICFNESSVIEFTYRITRIRFM